jgi:hypothetical protein
MKILVARATGAWAGGSSPCWSPTASSVSLSQPGIR